MIPEGNPLCCYHVVCLLLRHVWLIDWLIVWLVCYVSTVVFLSVMVLSLCYELLVLCVSVWSVVVFSRSWSWAFCMILMVEVYVLFPILVSLGHGREPFSCFCCVRCMCCVLHVFSLGHGLEPVSCLCCVVCVCVRCCSIITLSRSWSWAFVMCVVVCVVVVL